ncbi:hypothetical protein DICTH_0177 [Dictyoglomus thermophilum H-6-12]|uniref:Uncharacterized protein n=1 Tax=Dictyoglomus thermophilum (strain ATCC 35947 / DSM 3960 / H-6-12) TaxID=309799 RepID=B5YBJ4_DICT6|nr:hypothetical protein DICTH_0177 [Dictyoglomus thermophilum H-6-12]
MGIVENSHRQDDEYFLGIHAERCKNVKEFLVKAQRWQDTWNITRPSFGIGMDGKTPFCQSPGVLGLLEVARKMNFYFFSFLNCLYIR